jgi:hypothetical protein
MLTSFLVSKKKTGCLAFLDRGVQVLLQDTAWIQRTPRRPPTVVDARIAVPALRAA